MPVRLHHIVIDAHDLPGLARFWTQALGWKILSEREKEIVLGADENAPAGICFMPVTDPKTVKNRVHLELTTSAADRDQEIDRLLALRARAGPASGRPALSPGLSWPTRRETSSASSARRRRSPDEAQHREPQADPVRGQMSKFATRAAMHKHTACRSERQICNQPCRSVNDPKSLNNPAPTRRSGRLVSASAP
jgi:hypothetical protein